MTAPTIRAIETRYAGCRFRSRLEARWAVFFDQLDIPWIYEHEGVVLSTGEAYLPDFFLPSQGSDGWSVEVKGTRESLIASSRKISWYAREVRPLLILGEVPDVLDQDAIMVHPLVRADWAAGSAAAVAWSSAGHFFLSISRLSIEFDTSSHYVGGMCASRQIQDAYRAARSARFEFGETPIAPGRA
jgi:hypothetical protein